MMEVWRKIPEHSNYEASSLGEIRSLSFRRSGKVRIMRKNTTKKGYLRVKITKDCGKVHSPLVHRAVAYAFLGIGEDGFQINHKNGIKTDNRVENLEWCSPQQNIKHAFKNGLKTVLGENHPRTKLTNKCVLDIRRRVDEGEKRKDLAKELNISYKSICFIVSRSTWKHI